MPVGNLIILSLNEDRTLPRTQQRSLKGGETKAWEEVRNKVEEEF
jgi:hypothetical protein